MKNKRIIVSGVAGRIGAALATRLLEAGYEVGGFDSLEFGREAAVPKGVEFWHLSAIEMAEADLNRFDVLVSSHTANIVYAVSNSENTWRTNCIDTIELFSRFQGKIINLSTSSVYGNANILPTPENAPISLTNAYARSKYAAEQFLVDRGNYANLRLTNVYGGIEPPDYEYQAVVSKMICDALQGSPQTIIGDGTQTRDFVYCQDVIDAIIICIERESTNATFNIGSGTETNMHYLMMMIRQILELPFESHQTLDKRPIDNVNRRCMNIEKAGYVLGWAPKTPLIDGLKKTIDWYKSLK